MDNYNDIFTNQELDNAINEMYGTSDYDDISYLIK